ncbi:hypothetical protein CRG98_032240 [Punica granatum]|uniref:Uncharacterized protein n=1 Tax=Punica granatum TaxID=22663 RepID=A0A2I0ITT6_PUNGR|nr:hypothetical protein CRG98_032240 [Punica granatum]
MRPEIGLERPRFSQGSWPVVDQPLKNLDLRSNKQLGAGSSAELKSVGRRWSSWVSEEVPSQLGFAEVWEKRGAQIWAWEEEEERKQGFRSLVIDLRETTAAIFRDPLDSMGCREKEDEDGMQRRPNSTF